ncbi:hemocytin [Trichonephila clavipes]|nr:hemocytin [Trichonephila clavipes]
MRMKPPAWIGADSAHACAGNSRSSYKELRRIDSAGHPCSEFLPLIDGPNPLPDTNLKASSSNSPNSGPDAARFNKKGFKDQQMSLIPLISELGLVTEQYRNPLLYWSRKRSLLPKKSDAILSLIQDIILVVFGRDCIVEVYEHVVFICGHLDRENSPQSRIWWTSTYETTKVEFFQSDERHDGDWLSIEASLWLANDKCDHRLQMAAKGTENKEMGRARGDKGKAWTPAESNEKQFIEVDLGDVRGVYGIATKGKEFPTEWVTSYQLLYSTDGASYSYYQDESDNNKVFRGNYDESTEVKHVFKRPFEAKLVRLEPLTWEKKISLRLELLGCSEALTTPETSFPEEEEERMGNILPIRPVTTTPSPKGLTKIMTTQDFIRFSRLVI